MLLRGITVLLVEDDADNLELMAAYFDGEGARTLSASSMTAALAMSSVARVDVLVSDLELLDGDGCELLQGHEHICWEARPCSARGDAVRRHV